ncbi:hypothetical protein ACFW5D_30610 [Streptomyces sp. NPDC058770]|uniref:hypothetical protein n=1 Tax=unclassified Streptomyces TaxID=2593676 RepID=UPI0036920FBB
MHCGYQARCPCSVVAAYVLAHSVLYNYIAPFLGSVGLEERVDAVLLVFGGASVLGLWLVGTLIDGTSARW